MSNRQLGWDDQRIRDRLDPREIVQGEQAQFAQQEAEQNEEMAGGGDDKWIPPGNSAQGSRKD
jgi:hypothetical protein